MDVSFEILNNLQVQEVLTVSSIYCSGLTAIGSTNLSLSGGGNGASLALGQGSSGAFTFITKGATANLISAPERVNNTPSVHTALEAGADASLGPIGLRFETNPSATSTSRYAGIYVSDNSGYRSMVLQRQGGNVLIGNTENLSTTNGALIAAGAGVFKGGLQTNPSGQNISLQVSLNKCIISAKNGADYTQMYYDASEHIFTNYPIVCTTLLNLSLLQLNLVNTSTGSNASSIFRFNVGTSTATLQAYNNTHSTFASQLRVSTSAGNIVIIPSGTTSTTFSSSTVTISPVTASSSVSTGALVVTGGVGIGGNLNVGEYYGMVDGIIAPSTAAGYARIYVDIADGDLKIKFGDGTVKTIVTDT